LCVIVLWLAVHERGHALICEVKHMRSQSVRCFKKVLANFAGGFS